jgi:hypothetical protein
MANLSSIYHYMARGFIKYAGPLTSPFDVFKKDKIEAAGPDESPGGQ